MKPDARMGKGTDMSKAMKLKNGIAIPALIDATLFAAEKHRDQRRKDACGTPYINHPIAVVNLMTSVGKIIDVEVLQAGMLHDTVEDTETTPEEIEERFGYAVRSLVMEVTDDKELEKQERKRLQIEHAPHLSPRAKVIKLADKISNLRDLVDSPPVGWEVERRLQYVKWSNQVVAGCYGQNLGLESLYKRTAVAAAKLAG
jgi:guanosine-3',5'-bis(diphosphate) 3'-pyrophosphohydrolase